MAKEEQGINALGVKAAYNLANVTKTKPQYGALTPKWLTKFLEFKGLETGIYRVNKVIEGETPLDVLCSQTKKSDIIPDGYIEYETEPREYRLNSISTIINVNTVIEDVYSAPYDQTKEQLSLAIESLRERQESQLINNDDYGLLKNIPDSQRIQSRTGAPTPDDLDELISKVWKEPSFFLAHPRAIAAFERECTKRGVPPVTANIAGGTFILWRGIPIIPTDKLLVDGLKNPKSQSGKTNILLIRTGEAKRGVDGSIFQLDVCADGIEKLVTSGDTGVFDTASDKATKVFGGQLKTQDFENIISDLKQDAQYDEFSGLTGGFPAINDYVYADNNQSTGFTPRVISQKQADADADIQVRTTANDNNVVGDSDTVGGQKGNSQIVVGTKTLEQIRQDFPILQEKVNGNPLIWLDNGATTQRPNAVIDRLSYYYRFENSNVHRGAHTLAAKSTDAYEKTRQTVADFVGAPSKDNIVFVRGTTEGINLIAQSYVKPLLQPGDEIIVSLLEHHANIVPWQLIAQETGAVIKVIPVDDSGQLILSEYEKLFTKRTKFVSVTHVSNVLGTITPVAELIAIAHSHGVRILVDGAQSVAHIPVNVTALDADWFVFSGHKIYAPTGIGAVYGKKEVLEQAKPYHGGGNMIKDVTFERTVYNPAPNKFEAGTGSIADAVGLGAALEYLNTIGMPEISKYEHELVSYGMKELGKINGLHLIGTATNKSSALSFVLDGVSNDAVGQKLDQNGIAVRVGHHCAQPILRHYGLESVVRPTLALYNTFEDIDTLVKVLRSL